MACVLPRCEEDLAQAILYLKVEIILSRDRPQVDQKAGDEVGVSKVKG